MLCHTCRALHIQASLLSLDCRCSVVPTLWQQRAVENNFQEKGLLYIRDQTTRLLAARFCVAIAQGRCLFHWKTCRHQWRLDKVCQAIQQRLLEDGSSTHNLSVLLSAMERSCTTWTTLALVRWPSYSHTCVCAVCCCSYNSRAESSRRNMVASSLWRLQDLLLLQLLSTKDLTSREWRPGTLCISVWQKNFLSLNPLQCMI